MGPFQSATANAGGSGAVIEVLQVRETNVSKQDLPSGLSPSPDSRP